MPQKFLKVKIVFFVTLLVYFLGVAATHIGCSGHRDKERSSPAEIVSPEMMKADLEYVMQKLGNVHPKAVDGFSDIQKEIIQNI